MSLPVASPEWGPAVTEVALTRTCSLADALPSLSCDPAAGISGDACSSEEEALLVVCFCLLTKKDNRGNCRKF